ncbi:MAG: hypothetical protein LDL41_18620 [Coleofasciculus sp. S288]|nr:hypothetical protein [Coleofasciculus sp. S288]
MRFMVITGIIIAYSSHSTLRSLIQLPSLATARSHRKTSSLPTHQHIKTGEAGNFRDIATLRRENFEAELRHS